MILLTLLLACHHPVAPTPASADPAPPPTTPPTHILETFLPLAGTSCPFQPVRKE